MSYCRIKPASSVRGTISLPGDKSIAHRSIMISAIAKGKSYIYNFPVSQDCLTTLKVFRKLGVEISTLDKTKKYLNLCVSGRSLYGLSEPVDAVFVKQSGTTTRLILGILASANLIPESHAYLAF